MKSPRRWIFIAVLVASLALNAVFVAAALSVGIGPSALLGLALLLVKRDATLSHSPNVPANQSAATGKTERDTDDHSIISARPNIPEPTPAPANPPPRH